MTPENQNQSKNKTSIQVKQQQKWIGFAAAGLLLSVLLFTVLNSSEEAQALSTTTAGKDGSLVIDSDTTVNTYTSVIQDILVGDSSIKVLSISNLSHISYGDLVMVIQMQGASISTAPNKDWGSVTSLNDAGNYEYTYVRRVDSIGNILTVCPPLTKNYTSSV